MVELIKNPNFDILGKWKLAFIFSGTLILAGIISLLIHGGPRYNIDFTGGYLIQIQFSNPVDISEIRKILDNLNIKDASVQSFEQGRGFIIRAPVGKEGEDLSAAIINALKEKYPDNSFEQTRTEKVGPKVGKELRSKALWAIFWSLVCMLIYITFRFQFRFGVASVLALFHDVFIVIAIFSIFNLEISLNIVAALLTIVGYSINDSIVICDRIRENMRKITKSTFFELVNRSLNETLSRTVITSLVVFLILLALLIFGGKVIRDFALALTIGTIIGTYSSIFVVSPIVALWEQKSPKFTARMRR